MLEDRDLFLGHPPEPDDASQRVSEPNARRDEGDECDALERVRFKEFGDPLRNVGGDLARERKTLTLKQHDPQGDADRNERGPRDLEPRHAPARPLIQGR